MVILLYGLSSSGKSTIALELEKKFRRAGQRMVTILDGDILRQGLCSNLGFSREDRKENLRRVTECAKLLSREGVVTIMAMIAPYQEDREMARQICGEAPFIDVYIDCPLRVCKERDVKGLYKEAKKGKLTGLTGVDDPFEEPPSSSPRVDSSKDTPSNCAQKLFAEHLLIPLMDWKHGKKA